MNWTPHTGDVCPVPPDTLVRVRLIDGEDSVEAEASPAGSWAWGPGLGPNGEGRIAAYQVLAPVGDLSSNAVGTAARFNSGKPPLDLIPAGIMARVGPSTVAWAPGSTPSVAWGAVLELLERLQMHAPAASGARACLTSCLLELNVIPGMWAECARVFDYGRRKYAAWNWAKGQPWSVPLGSALRHIVLGILAGEENDPESGETHRGHVVCNIVMLLWFVDHYPEGNDLRVPPASACADRFVGTK